MEVSANPVVRATILYYTQTDVETKELLVTSFRTSPVGNSTSVVKLTISPELTVALIERIGCHPSIERVLLTDGRTVTVVTSGISTEESLSRLCLSLKEWCSQ